MTPAQIYRQLGSIVRSRRKQLALTQHALAARLGISRAALANIETGRQKVFAHHLYAFAAELELSPAELLPPATTPVETWTELMPDDLKPEQKTQIAQLLKNVPIDVDGGR
jgi:transcriptional regulator with XRE-family HTH domain